MINASKASLGTNRIPSISDDNGLYPRPQLRRRHWRDLNGTWDFRFGDEDDVPSLCSQPWLEHCEIVVPFPPESPASGIADTSYHAVVWYARMISPTDVEDAGYEDGMRLLLHFGAVDYRCEVWVDGSFAGDHEGGHTPFTIDITNLAAWEASHRIVVRAEDDPTDASQPRGKQDWREAPHAIWYNRTTGIWQPVWLEAVPPVAIETVDWITDQRSALVTARVRLAHKPVAPQPLTVSLAFQGEFLADVTTIVDQVENTVVISLPGLVNGQAMEDLLWSPEQPRLVDARVAFGDDVVDSYFGIRTAEVAGGRFLLNNVPCYLRGVLSQGYWPDSYLAAPSGNALRDEVQLIKDLGFNMVRMHQKYEDPRFLTWADRLGLLVWGESPAAYAFTPLAIMRTVKEWTAALSRDRSHPSIVMWVPFNESWGIQHAASVKAQRDFECSLVHLTRALDPTRPVVANDGWEQIDSDVIAIHDYRNPAETMRQRYRNAAAIQELMRGIGPEGRRLVLQSDVSQAAVILSEFGGIAFDPGDDEQGWGYLSASSRTDFVRQLRELFAAIEDSDVLAGSCYTQLADTGQEVNGLVRANREPKLPIEQVRAIVTGQDPCQAMLDRP